MELIVSAATAVAPPPYHAATIFAPLSARWTDLDPRLRHSFRFDRGATPLSSVSDLLLLCTLYHVLVWSTAALSAALFGGARDPRRPKLRLVTAAHNFFLCVFSAVVLAGCLYDTWACVSRRGWRGCMCAVSDEEVGGALYYWGYIFYLSKFYEYLDTVLLAVKGKPLTLLHVYHHTVVAPMMWTFFPHGLSLVSWGVLANSAVHVLMYFYFALASLGVKGLGPFRRAMTTVQIVQFVWSFIGSAPFLLFAFGGGGNTSPVIGGGLHCRGAPSFYFGSIINATFLILFVRFYLSSYGARAERGNKSGNKSKKE